MTYVRMADAAYAGNIPPGFDIAAGYYGGADAYHIWPSSDWARFPGYRLPVYVPGPGPKDGAIDGRNALDLLRDLDVPPGAITAVDCEQWVDRTYLQRFYATLNGSNSHYLLWVYGSASTVFANPPCNGYWVADYTPSLQAIDQMLQLPHVRAVQDTPNVAPGYDLSLVKAEGEMWHG